MYTRYTSNTPLNTLYTPYIRPIYTTVLSGSCLFETISGGRPLRRRCLARGATFAHVIGTGNGEIMGTVAALMAGGQVVAVVDREYERRSQHIVLLPYMHLCTPVIHVYTPYIHLTHL